MYRLILVPLMSLAFLGPAHAEQQKPLEVELIVAQQAQIRADILAANGAYRGLTSLKQRELLERQDRLLRLLDGKQAADQLTPQEQMLAFNHLEWIEAALNDEESERMICRNQTTIGSHRKTRVCRTAAQIERDRQQVREQVYKPGSLSCAPGAARCGF